MERGILNNREEIMAVKLVEVFRGGIVDCVHYGNIAVVTSDGRLLHSLGDPDRVTYFRSSFKPLQGIVALEKGIVELYGLELREVALLVSSHNGEAKQIEALKGVLEKTGISEGDLECGVHEPYEREAARDMYLRGETPTRLHCNCSGKHIGMIAAVKAMGLPVKGYSMLEHGIQREVGRIIRDFCGVAPENVQVGIDGCGIPVYAVPLKKMAVAYACLCDPGFMGGKYGKSQNYVISAMTMYPEMVGGREKFDTELMRKFGDRILSKTGAEGVYCAGLPGKGIGIAVKIEDGSERAVGPVVTEMLIKMGVISPGEYDNVQELRCPPILNHRGEKVGELKAVF